MAATRALALLALLAALVAGEHLVPEIERCSFTERDYWVDTVRDVRLAFSYGGVATEITPVGVQDVRVTLDPASNNLTVFYPAHPQAPLLCGNDGHYRVEWGDQFCRSAFITVVDDALCPQRAATFHNLDLTREAKPTDYFTPRVGVPTLRCGFPPSTTWLGVYPGQPDNAGVGAHPVLGLQPLRLFMGNKTDVVESSPVASIGALWGVDSESGNLLVYRDQAEGPDDPLACFSTNPDAFGVYTLAWDDDCTVVTLALLRDPECERRRLAYDNLSLRLEGQTLERCAVWEEESFRGRYPATNPDLRNLPIALALDAEGLITERSHDAAGNEVSVRQSVWTQTSQLGTVQVDDVFANPFRYACAAISGLYNEYFSFDCTHRGSRNVVDACSVRRQLYDDLTIQLVQSQCEFVPGQQWSGLYAGDLDVLSGNEIAVKIQPWGVVEENWETETIGFESGSFDTRWYAANDTQIIDVRWHSSSNEKFGCDPSDQGLYRIRWTQECSVVQFVLLSDPCADRSVLYDGLHLLKKEQECQFFPADEWLTKTVLPGTRDGFAGDAASFNFDPSSVSTVTFATATTGNTVNQRWFVNSLGNVQIFDRSSSPETWTGCDADSDVGGIYFPTWSDDCTEVRLDVFQDTCANRTDSLDSLTLVRNDIQPLFDCSIFPGSSWHGHYPADGGNPALSGKSVTAHFGADAARIVAERNDFVTFAATAVYNTTSDLFTLVDNDDQRCEAGVTGLYDLQFVEGSACSRMHITLPPGLLPVDSCEPMDYRDNCGNRRALWQNLELERVKSHCKFLQGDRWLGTYSGADTDPYTLAGKDVAFTWLSDERVREDSAVASMSSSFFVNDVGNLVVTQERTDNTAFVCPDIRPSEYALVWDSNDECGTVCLHPIFDTCPQRRAAYAGMCLHRARDNGPRCAFQIGATFRGAYGGGDGAGALAHTDAAFTCRGQTAVWELNDQGSIDERWFMDDDGVLNVRDVDANGPGQCDSSMIGRYHISWSWDCRTVEFCHKYDPCTQRRALFSDMILAMDDQQCAFEDGQLWDGVFPTDAPRAGASVAAHVRANGAVELSSGDDEADTGFAVWSSEDRTGAINVRDAFPWDAAHAHGCAAESDARYSLLWSSDCGHVTFHAIDDDCDAREHSMHNLQLMRTVEKREATKECTEAEVDIQFNFAGLIPEESKCCAQKPPPPPTPPPPPPAPRRPAFIFGNFIDALTQEPITPGTVTCTYTTFEPNTVSSDSADRFGAYSIGPLFHAGLGDYVCQCEAPGYQRPSSDDVQVLEGTRVRYDCVLLPAPSCVNGQISSSADGRLLPLTTEAICTTLNNDNLRQTTDVNATYEFDNVQSTGPVNCTGRELCGRYGSQLERGTLQRGQCTTIDIALDPTVLIIKVFAQVFAPSTPIEPQPGITVTATPRATCCDEGAISGVTEISTTGVDRVNATVAAQPVCSERWDITAFDASSSTGLLPASLANTQVDAGVVNEKTLLMTLDLPDVLVRVLGELPGGVRVPAANAFVRFNFNIPGFQDETWDSGSTGPLLGTDTDGYIKDDINLFLPFEYRIVASAPGFSNIDTPLRVADAAFDDTCDCVANGRSPGCRCLTLALLGLSGSQISCLTEPNGNPVPDVLLSLEDVTGNAPPFPLQTTDETGCVQWDNVPLTQADDPRYFHRTPAATFIPPLDPNDPGTTCLKPMVDPNQPERCDRTVVVSFFGGVRSDCVDVTDTTIKVACTCNLTTAPLFPPVTANEQGQWTMNNVPINDVNTPQHSISCTAPDYSTATRTTTVIGGTFSEITPAFALQPALVRMWGTATAAGAPLAGTTFLLFNALEGEPTDTPPGDLDNPLRGPPQRSVSGPDGAFGNPPPHTGDNLPAFEVPLRFGYWLQTTPALPIFPRRVEFIDRVDFEFALNQFDLQHEITVVYDTPGRDEE